VGPTHYRSTAKYAAGKTSRTALRDRCDVLWTYGSSPDADSRTIAQGIHCLLWKPTVCGVCAGVTGGVMPCNVAQSYRLGGKYRHHKSGHMVLGATVFSETSVHLPRYTSSRPTTHKFSQSWLQISSSNVHIEQYQCCQIHQGTFTMYKLAVRIVSQFPFLPAPFLLTIHESPHI
jgi:hypothetical protein